MVERIRTLLETRQLTPTQFADVIGVARPIVSHILSGRNKPSLEVVQRILAAMPDLSMPWLLNGSGPMLAQAVPVTEATHSPVTVPRERAVPAPAPVASAVAAPEFEPPVRPLRSAAPFIPPTLRKGTEAREMPRRFTSPAAKTKQADEALPTVPAAPQTQPPIAPAPAFAAVPEEVPAIREPDTAQPGATTAPVVDATPAMEATTQARPAAESTAAALFAGAEKPIRRIVIFYRDGSFADYQPE